MKAVVAAFNQEKALVGAFSVITNLRIAFVWSTSSLPQILKYQDFCIVPSPWPIVTALFTNTNHRNAPREAQVSGHCEHRISEIMYSIAATSLYRPPPRPNTRVTILNGDILCGTVTCSAPAPPSQSLIMKSYYYINNFLIPWTVPWLIWGYF